MFSIVIPLYNKELSVTKTLQSVLDQTFTEFEVVIINDGSTDASVSKVEAFNDPRIRLIHQANAGVSAARNKGVEEGNYDWICFLDADDLWNNNHLEEVVKMMKAYPDEKVFVTSFKYSDNRKINIYFSSDNIVKINNYFKEAIKGPLIWTSIVVVNKKCFNKVGFFNNTLIRGEDKDMWARLGRNYSIIKSQTTTAVYRLEAENRSDKKTHIKSTFESIINLSDVKSVEEYKYYKYIIIAKIKAKIVRKEFYSLIYLLVKHNIKLLRLNVYRQ